MVDRVGDQVGAYRLASSLGQGEFADVYLAEHILLKTPAALKVLHTPLGDAEVAAFLAQARTIAQLQHPHIVRILEYGIEQGMPFVAMEYAPLGNLRQRHARGKQLPLVTIISYVKQIATALQYVHDQNLIHCDIKPHNMLLGAIGDILLSDFDIASVSQQLGYHKYKARHFEGTILYAAPEQLRGRAHFASDQYALAVVVYEWLSGNVPFQGTAQEVARQHALAAPPPLIGKVPALSATIEQIVLRALAKDPYRRFESIQEFATALERAGRLEQPTFSTRPFSSPFPSPIRGRTPEKNQRVDTPLYIYSGHTERVHCLAWSPVSLTTDPRHVRDNGYRIASSSLDETIQVWDIADTFAPLVYRSNALQEQALAWSPDAVYIASTPDLLCETVQIWHSLTGKAAPTMPTYRGHSGKVLALAWSPDGKYIASGSEDGTIHVWEVTSGRTLLSYRGHADSVGALAWSAAGPASSASAWSGWRIASGSADRTVQVWDALTGGNVRAYYAHRDKINALAWSPAGTHVASASDDGTVHIWDASTGRKAFVYSAHPAGVTAVAWSPDGTRVVSGGMDETVHLWHALTGMPICAYCGHSDWVSTVAWSPDGRFLASGSWDKTVHVWQAGTQAH